MDNVLIQRMGLLKNPPAVFAPFSHALVQQERSVRKKRLWPRWTKIFELRLAFGMLGLFGKMWLLASKMFNTPTHRHLPSTLSLASYAGASVIFMHIFSK